MTETDLIDLSQIVVYTQKGTGEIFIGLGKPGTRDVFSDSRPAEPEVLFAVIDHMMHDAPKGSTKVVSLGKRAPKYRITVEPAD